MPQNILLVEDLEGHQFFFKKDIKDSFPDAELTICDSLQDVMNEYITPGRLPDCAIVDIKIFEHSKPNRPKGEQLNWRCGIDVLERLLASGLSTKKIFIVSGYLGDTAHDLQRLGLRDRVTPKPIDPEFLKAEIDAML